MKTVIAACIAIAGLSSAQTAVKHVQPGNGAFAQCVWAGDTLYLSGQIATAVTPADRGKGTPADYGDTKTQTANVLGKIEAVLKEQGLTMGDVVMAHVYLAGDPKNEGKMDFAGMNAAYLTYFGTKDQPNKPARSAMQVAALAAPGALVEIEMIAVKSAH
jgi:enamine deaminase RidA (YjgF/YER057c/UK114 family)